MRIGVAFQKMCKIVLFIIKDKCNVFAPNFDSNDSFNTWRNVSLQIALIAIWAYTKDPKILFKSLLCASRSTVISPQFLQLWRNT